MVESASLHNFFEQFNHNGLLVVLYEYYYKLDILTHFSFFNIQSLTSNQKIDASFLLFLSYSVASLIIFFFVFLSNLKEFNDIVINWLKKIFVQVFFLVKNLLYFFSLFSLWFCFYWSIYFFFINTNSNSIFINNLYFQNLTNFEFNDSILESALNFNQITFFSSLDNFFFFKFDESYVSFIITFMFIFLLNVTSHRSSYGFLIPNKLQLLNQKIFFFFFYVFYSNLGSKVYSQIFFRIIYVLGLLILFFNIEGMLHYLPTITSSLINTIYLSSIVFFSIFICLVAYNSIRYFLNMLYPAGATFALAFLLIPIELISYVFRLISLSVRLFANMMAGHTLLKVIASFVINLLTLLINSYYLVITMFIPIVLLYILTNLEIGVSLIQTYIFVILSSIYIKDIFYEH